MMYGDLPYEVLSIPVAKFQTDIAQVGSVGMQTTSGDITVDRFIFVNLSNYSEIPDDIVPPDPDPVDPDPIDPDPPKPKGCGAVNTVSAAILLSGLTVLTAAAYLIIRYKKKKLKN